MPVALPPNVQPGRAGRLRPRAGDSRRHRGVARWGQRIRVRTTLEGTVGTDISLNKDQTRFAVRLPADSQGTVRFDAIGLDLMGCKLAKRSLTEKVPDNISRFVELPLVLSLLSFHVCVLEPATNFAVGARPSQWQWEILTAT